MTIANWFSLLGESFAKKMAKFRLGRSSVTIAKISGPPVHLEATSLVPVVVMGIAGLPVAAQVGSISVQIAPASSAPTPSE